MRKACYQVDIAVMPAVDARASAILLVYCLRLSSVTWNHYKGSIALKNVPLKADTLSAIKEN